MVIQSLDQFRIVTVIRELLSTPVPDRSNAFFIIIVSVESE